ncbi:unnamed protein product [Paramecium sonneborni]|uniref:Uncharacterized protein n=1 Tax=Paramecium sonneborni TaxID=65129 RepID=A0A8S1MCH8_9CILI|nr:unnamed protein product [Paramecium sonneborni]
MSNQKIQKKRKLRLQKSCMKSQDCNLLYKYIQTKQRIWQIFNQSISPQKLQLKQKEKSQKEKNEIYVLKAKQQQETLEPLKLVEILQDEDYILLFKTNH